jgi:hypothetical protein
LTEAPVENLLQTPYRQLYRPRMMLNGWYSMARSVRKHVFKKYLFKTLELHRTRHQRGVHGLLGTGRDSQAFASYRVPCLAVRNYGLNYDRHGNTAFPCATAYTMGTHCWKQHTLLYTQNGFLLPIA